MPIKAESYTDSVSGASPGPDISLAPHTLTCVWLGTFTFAEKIVPIMKLLGPHKGRQNIFECVSRPVIAGKRHTSGNSIPTW